MSAGQVALVTGASRGIGRAIAQTLAEQGFKVTGTATTEAGASGISQALTGFAGCRGVCLDVNDKTGVDALVEAIVKEHGALHVLVNNAGITRDQLAMRMKDEDWAAVLDTNLGAVFRMCRAVMRGMMKQRHGRIINITSVVGASGNAGQANYAAAKAGVAGMTRALARELGSRNITVNCVAPGLMRNRHDRRPARGAKDRTAAADPPRPPGYAAGDRARGRLPRLTAGGLHHRYSAARQRRHVHELKGPARAGRRRAAHH